MTEQEFLDRYFKVGNITNYLFHKLPLGTETNYVIDSQALVVYNYETEGYELWVEMWDGVHAGGGDAVRKAEITLEAAVHLVVNARRIDE